MYIGQRIKELRLKKSMTQAELAELLFVSDRTISKWEQERGNPDINTLEALSTILSVSIDYLITGKEYTPTTSENTKIAVEYFESVIGQRIENEYTIRMISKYFEKYTLDQIKDALDTSYNSYLAKKEKPYSSMDIREAINKIGGILYNQTLSPLDRKISQLLSYLSKNTTSTSPFLKKECEAKIRTFLGYAGSRSEEEKIQIVENMYSYYRKRNTDLKEAIVDIKNKTLIVEHNKIKRLRIEKGYITKVEYAPSYVNDKHERLNQALRDNDILKVKSAMIEIIQFYYDSFAIRADNSLKKEDMPPIDLYLNYLKDIFGRIITKRIAKLTKYYVAQYPLNKNSKIFLEEIDQFVCLEELLAKQRKRKKVDTLSKNFDKQLFSRFIEKYKELSSNNINNE